MIFEKMTNIVILISQTTLKVNKSIKNNKKHMTCTLIYTRIFRKKYFQQTYYSKIE